MSKLPPVNAQKMSQVVMTVGRLTTNDPTGSNLDCC